jgi:hypothetical protein
MLLQRLNQLRLLPYIGSSSIAVRRKRRLPQAAPTTRKWGLSMALAPQRSVRDDSKVFAAVRELYSRLPETRTLAPYEIQGTLWLVHYTNEFAPEAEIAAAMEVARGD